MALRPFFRRSRFRSSTVGAVIGAAAVVVGGVISFRARDESATKDRPSSLIRRWMPRANAAEEQTLCEDEKRKNRRFDSAIAEARKIVELAQIESGAPGVVIGVSVDGAVVWREGFGLADVENRVACGPETVMRIASISKPITVSLLATLVDDGRLDLDADIADFFLDFPTKSWEGRCVSITPRMLASHLSGIRHYKEEEKKKTQEKGKKEKEGKREGKKEGKKESDVDDKNKKKSEFDAKEYYIKDHFDSVTDSLVLFKDDPLTSEPGTKFLYSTHGYTLLSAVVEAAANGVEKGKRVRDEDTGEECVPSRSSSQSSGQSPFVPFSKLLSLHLARLGMDETHLEEHAPLLPYRARHYRRDKRHVLRNAPYVDNSYKWAGGGLVSTVGDLLKFAQTHVYAFRRREGTDGSYGFVSPSTLRLLWSPVPNTRTEWAKDVPGAGYGLGWTVVPGGPAVGGTGTASGGGGKTPMYVGHTGGAVGGSSVLVMAVAGESCGGEEDDDPNQSVAVAMIANLQEVGLYKTARKILDLFLDERGTF